MPAQSKVEGNACVSLETKHNVELSAWALSQEVHAINERRLAAGLKRRELGVTWSDLTVEVPSVDTALNHNFVSQFNLHHHLQAVRHKPPPRTILENSYGCVMPGEMLLVLGRPGAGCSTLLKLLSNRRQGLPDIKGNVRFGTLDYTEAAQYRSQIIMNTEEEIFFPTLTVGNTMDFATRLKIPARRPDELSGEAYRQQVKDFLLRSMGIEHTANTLVGNEYVRGVSGGERKRVSIIECMASQGSIFCWDNSTRGLDASTALDWAKALRAMTDTFGLATVVTLYQAGNGIFNCFDKVLVLDEGKQIFYGKASEARPFLEELGFVCRAGANVADFLTGVTVPTERQIRPGYENSFPRTASEIRMRFEASPIHTRMRQEMQAYPETERARQCTQEFQESVGLEKDKTLSSNSAFTVGLWQQICACIIRQYQILWNDKATFLIKQISTLIQALVAGSLFYNAAPDSTGLFVKSGSLFFAIMYNGLMMPLSEVTDSFNGRPVLVKHKFFGFFHPSAFCIAQIVIDIPVLLFQLTHFSLILYFMTGLTMSAGHFFTYWIMLFASTMCLTAMFRAIGAMFRTFDGASKISGFLVTALVIYTGYMIHKPQMHPWLGWIFWINPLAYGFEALLATEFHQKRIDCVAANLIPSGPEYTNRDHMACSGVAGALRGATSVTGEQYLDALSYSHSHVWRNFGILWAWWALFVAVTIVFTIQWTDGSTGSSMLLPYEKRKHYRTAEDEESLQNSSSGVDQSSEKNAMNDMNLVRNTSIFTWQNLSYTVKVPTGERVLLNNIYGWVEPGSLTALMGSSGAGKTTLLDVLAQRKTEGSITGSVLVDGRPLPIAFQRSTGYCEQLDVHEPYSTVREALQFSALLRQPRHVPQEEKLAYVETIINLLELHDIADTLIGRVGAGLNVEQRKRVTIGVELVAKPKILLFLDEPTSGLDGQSAFNTVRFLRRLADCGQAILVTIHQPSAQLFSQFNNLILLARGGKMVYFGPIGDDGCAVKEYFGGYGAICPPDANPAEFMIDVVQGNVLSGVDWHEVWTQSKLHGEMSTRLEAILEDARNKPLGYEDDEDEFATGLWYQVKVVTQRMNISLFRNTDYVNNKIILHVIQGLFTGFSFWKVGSSVTDLQLRLFVIWNVIFVAPGVINQLQPLFIERRNIYDAREKKSRIYSWKAFVTGLIVSEFPYLSICAVLYFLSFYYTVGFPNDSNKSGATFFVIWLYEFIYTGLGQAIAAYAPNATFAALANPLILGTVVACCGVLVPYSQITAFWRFWLYYLNPFTYVTGSLLVINVFGAPVECKESELAIFNPPAGQTCGEYLSDYQNGLGSRTNLHNPTAVSDCRVCIYRNGADYLYTLNLKDYYYGWRDIGITVIFIISSYSMVYLMMKARTKASKKAE
ncbi:hypothetical protein BDW75DRAFT_247119 [Aspergillus navahoensis]